MKIIKRFWENIEDSSIKICSLIVPIGFLYHVFSVTFDSTLESVSVRTPYSFYLPYIGIITRNIRELVSHFHLTNPNDEILGSIIILGLLFLFVVVVYLIISVLTKETINTIGRLMKSPQSVWNQFISIFRDNALIFFLVLIYILFYRFWESWIGTHIIDPILSHFESNLMNDIIFFIVTIICFVLLSIIPFVKSFARFEKRTMFFSIIAFVVWAYYRFHHGQCGVNDSSYYLHLTPLSIKPSIKYFDILFIFSTYGLVSYFRWKYLNLFPSELSFNTDLGLTRNLPISHQDQDVLERNQSAKSIIDKLLETNTVNSSFTYGIDAPWGSGKTSFINLMKNHLELYKRIIIVDFNPWLYATEKDLVTAFFDELSKTLKPYDTSLAKNLIDYSKLLSAFNITETKMISSLMELTQHDDDSLQEKKQQISDTIKRIKRKITVFIDDLDRLESNEILEMMKLIRNVSDFPYMYIIAAYDKSYVVRCLNAKMKFGATDYIEKIFEHEHILAPCSNESLRRELANQLGTHDRASFLTPELKTYIMDHNNKALNALSNLRDIYRLSNSIASTYSLIKPEPIHEIDLLLFELFKTKYPVAFSLFEHKWHEILQQVKQDDRHYYYLLYQGSDQDGHFDFIQYLSNHQEGMCLNEFDIKTIKIILSELFMHQVHDNDDAHRIENARWFNRYLNLTQLKSDITEKEFNDTMCLPFYDIKLKFDDWCIDKFVSLEFRLLNYDENIKFNRQLLEKNIYGLIYFCHKNQKMYFYKLDDIISHLKEFSKGKFSIQDSEFITGVLKDNGYSVFISNYIGHLYKLYKKKHSVIPLIESDLIEVQQSIFNDCLNSCQDVSNRMKRVLLCYSNLLGYRRVESLKGNFINTKYKQALSQKMKKYAEDNIKEFLQCTMNRKERIATIRYGKVFYRLVGLLWGSWDKFSEFVSQIENPDPIIAKLKEESMDNHDERLNNKINVFVHKLF